jgi:hypothetical protein
VNTPRVLVVKLSESFADLWDTLAADVGAEFSVSTVLSPTGTDSDLAALVLAAGGSERGGAAPRCSAICRRSRRGTSHGDSGRFEWSLGLLRHSGGP